jgi:hypothetical protein
MESMKRALSSIENESLVDVKKTKVEEITTKRCCNPKCCQPQPLAVDEFTKNKRAKDGLNPCCKQCKKQQIKKYNNSDRGFLKMLLNDARKSSKARNEKGRHIEFTLTIEQLKAKWAKQSGLCHLSGIPMVMRPHSDFKCSIERLDNSIGYTDDNTVLIVLEMNTCNQWDQRTIQYLFSDVRCYPIEFNNGELEAPFDVRKGRAPKKWSINDDGTVLCQHCNVVKVREDFEKKFTSGCKSCIGLKRKARVNTWYGALRILHNSARDHAKHRKMEFSLSFEELVDIMKQQGGLCYYSGKPMQSKSGDYKVSIERLNPLITYTKENTVLICQEFNSGDRTRIKTTDSNTGSAGWSNEKYELVKHSVMKMASAACN